MLPLVDENRPVRVLGMFLEAGVPREGGRRAATV